LFNGSITRTTYKDTWFNGGNNYYYGSTCNDSLSRGVNCSTAGSTIGTDVSNFTAKSAAEYSAEITPVNDAGITVPGSISDQEFNTVAAFPMEAEKHVIVLKLLGQTESNKVVEPVTVKAKPKCTSCGRTNKATAKFCTNCGTSLTIV